MIIGLPKEVKTKENRVALKPTDVATLVAEGHNVKVQENAGKGAGYPNEEYEKAGATMVNSAKDAYDTEMVVKVKEPIKQEYDLLKENTILYTYLHLAADESTKELTQVLLDKNITGIAYETVTNENKELPLLEPMSLIAGQLAIDYGARFLQTFQGGRGKLIGVVPGADPTNVVILGGGNVGYGSLVKAAGSKAETYVLDINPKKVAELSDEFKDHKNVHIIQSDDEKIKEYVSKADLLVGAILLPGGKAPKIVTEDMVKTMKDGAVIVDVAIDQGGCTELSKPTTHEEPIYKEHGKIFCCITNMPGSVARSSTQALTAVTVPYAINLAKKGLEAALKEDPGFAEGVNTYKGFITYEAVAKDLGMMDKYKKLEDLL
ncbi:MAG: alanine dehydrogenase [Nanoarchaeota archaeon]|nr:alanine dehydrogenase [Nanoarchaeota archaeon]MCG2717854.1 alanine dehydrogenase [Nanoarchaeota archaeon]